MSLVNFPKVTVITVVYNLIEHTREKFFRQCVESVCKQTYPNIEHIIIDGVSTDGTLKLLKEYAKKGWITYYSEPDTGIYDAMNKGILRSTGKYIAFLNSDDYYCDNYGIEKSVEILENSQVEFSYASAYVLHNAEIVCSICPKIENFFVQMPFCHQTVLMKKDILIKEGMFDTSFVSASDYDLVVRMILKGYKSVHVSNFLVVFRHGGYSTNGPQNILLSQKEQHRVWNKYFPDMTVKIRRKNGWAFLDFFVTNDLLKRLTSLINEKNAPKIRYRKVGKKFKIRNIRYYDFLIKTYFVFQKILFFKKKSIKIPPNNNGEKIWYIFGIELFRIKKSRDFVKYYLLYAPIFATNNTQSKS
ncbi:MAG: glycosyltransferase [Holosporaceae bacterium]|jgi:glycosyltransferase involved in cell wall biosynthesis|nr:glycosyltransferase [Holosporaceae bacterium]